MKRTLLRRGAVLAACAVTMIFAACKNYDFDGRVDTVYSLETPSVTAKAYPGVNVVSWKPVTGAKSYNLTVYEEGFQRGSVYTATTDYSFTDTNLKNGKTYTYYVEAVSRSNFRHTKTATTVQP